MVKKTFQSDRRFKLELKKFLLNSKPGWKFVQLDNGNYLLEPRCLFYLSHFKNYFRYTKLEKKSMDFNINNIDNIQLHENSVLQTIAARAYMRPSKALFERHIKPSTTWSSIRYCWSSFAKAAPVHDFWEPVPGVISSWKDKLFLLLDAYSRANLIPSNILNINHINVKIGLDGTNLWKAKLETITLSFAHFDNDLYKIPNACHLLMF
jgi:hypothetical protein